MKTQPMKIALLNCAEELIQKRGYNGFSFADIAEIVGIRKASIHHHFPTKADLGIAVIQRYRDVFNQHLIEIRNTTSDWAKQIQQYAKLYEAVLRKERLCLCGMLASDIATLPAELKSEIQGFFKDNVDWLILVLRSNFSSLSTKRLTDIAWEIISSLQGATILANMNDNPDLFTAISSQMILQLRGIV